MGGVAWVVTEMFCGAWPWYKLVLHTLYLVGKMMYGDPVVLYIVVVLYAHAGAASKDETDGNKQCDMPMKHQRAALVLLAR